MFSKKEKVKFILHFHSSSSSYTIWNFFIILHPLVFTNTLKQKKKFNLSLIHIPTNKTKIMQVLIDKTVIYNVEEFNSSRVFHHV